MGENLFQNLSVVNIEEYFSLDNSRVEFAGVGARRVKLWYSTANPPQHPRYGEPDPTPARWERRVPKRRHRILNKKREVQN
jgi:hypothetical protein